MYLNYMHNTNTDNIYRLTVTLDVFKLQLNWVQSNTNID